MAALSRNMPAFSKNFEHFTTLLWSEVSWTDSNFLSSASFLHSKCFMTGVVLQYLKMDMLYKSPVFAAQ